MTWDETPTYVSKDIVSKMKDRRIIDSDGFIDKPQRADTPTENVESAIANLSPIIADMLRIQLLTGLRPSEVCKMKIGDIKKTKGEFAEFHYLFDGENWLYLIDG